MSKECSRCGDTKAITEFNKQASIKCGLSSHCRDCNVGINKQRQTKAYVYRVINISTGDTVYYGESTNKYRWADHVSDSKLLNPPRRLHQEMAKHGVDNFKFEVLAICESKEQAKALEAHLIGKNPNVYNLVGSASYNSSFAPKSVICTSTGEKFTNMSVAAREMGLNISGISACCNGKRVKTGGHTFELETTDV